MKQYYNRTGAFFFPSPQLRYPHSFRRSEEGKGGAGGSRKHANSICEKRKQQLSAERWNLPNLSPSCGYPSLTPRCACPGEAAPQHDPTRYHLPRLPAKHQNQRSSAPSSPAGAAAAGAGLPRAHIEHPQTPRTQTPLQPPAGAYA